MYRIKLTLADGSVLEGVSANIKEAFLAYKGARREGTLSKQEHRVELFNSLEKLIAVFQSDNYKEHFGYVPSDRETELARLLAVSACPVPCDGEAYRNQYGDWEQCQFCYERKEALYGLT